MVDVRDDGDIAKLDGEHGRERVLNGSGMSD